MKRFVWALSVVAAWVLFCLPAWAQEIAAQTAKILPEPDVLKVPWWMPLIGVLIAGLRTAFSNDTVKFPWEWAGKWRAAGVAVLAAVGTLVEQLIGGFDLKTAVLTFVMLGLPSIVQEVLKAVLGAPKPSSSSGAGTGGGIRPPPGYSSPMKALVLAGCVLALPGCATFKDVPKQVGEISSVVLRDVQEAAQIVDALHSVATVFFLLHSAPETQAKVEQGFAAVSLALNAASRAASGAKQASDAELDLAFANFRAAYVDLTAMLKNLGIISPDSAKMGAVRSAGGQLEIPEPRAARARVGS